MLTEYQRRISKSSPEAVASRVSVTKLGRSTNQEKSCEMSDPVPRDCATPAIRRQILRDTPTDIFAQLSFSRLHPRVHRTS